MINNEKIRFLIESVLASHIASVLLPFLMTPFDVAKTKAMCEIALSKDAEYKRCVKIIFGIASKEGFPGIYKGAIMGIICSFSHNMLLLIASHLLSLQKDLDLSTFFMVNGIISTLVYPLDTVTFNY